jgi:hypothetical protein
MDLMKNKNLIQFITLVILASCSTSSENLYVQSIEPKKNNAKDLEAMYTYQSFFPNDVKIIQEAIDNDALNQEQLRDAKLLKSNYQKILSKKKYSIELTVGQQYSKEIIELIYKLNLPINISWNEKKQSSFPENILSEKINFFCYSLYDDAISSLNQKINQSPKSVLVIYSQEYESFIKTLKLFTSNLITVEYDESNHQDFSSQIMEINFSEKRYKKISSLNPNQNLNFVPRPRADVEQVIIFLNPQEYKSMIPALRYHGGNRFEYLNFISSLEDILNPLQLLDYEDSFIPISDYLTTQIIENEYTSLERFIELGVLNEWLLLQVLTQAGVRSAKVNGITGIVTYQSNACAKRRIPMQKIRSDLFSI